MSKYIDADALKIPSEEMIVKMIIDSAPSIDIVRCKECWHGTDIKNGKEFCIRCDIMDDLLMIADGFCNFGEREGE